MNTLPGTELLGSSYIEIHYRRPNFYDTYSITGPKDANFILRKYINLRQLDLRESFWVILLTNANRVIAISKVTTGTTTGVLTNPKYIFQLALLTNASAIIIAHNHPSGSLKISGSDIEETKKIKQLAALMDMSLLDHLIITSESYTSMVQEGKL
jgi:DNA repair protein RadC